MGALDIGRDGVQVVRNALQAAETDLLRARAWALAEDPRSTEQTTTIFESNLDAGLEARDRVSKVIGPDADAAVWQTIVGLELLGLVGQLIGPDVDLFLSQIVFKLPGSYGQPMHQDASIFPFDPPGPIIAAWIALTDAASSCLEVLPGSHSLPLQPHAKDRGHRTHGRYFSLVDELAGDPVRLDLGAGDAVVFDGHLAHASRDNTGDTARIALVLHFARHGTIDHSADRFTKVFNRWRPVLIAGQPVSA